MESSKEPGSSSGGSKSAKAKGKHQQEKFETWNSLTLSERLDRVGASVQKVKDSPYAQEGYNSEAKFAVGDPVAVCYQGYYYHAVVSGAGECFSSKTAFGPGFFRLKNRLGEAALDKTFIEYHTPKARANMVELVTGIEKPYLCSDLNKMVPLYKLKYPGWGERSGSVTEELVVEYDMIGTTKHTVAHELLYAHYWNKAKVTDKKVKKVKSLFELPPRTLQKLENKWRTQIKEDNPDQDSSFAQWIGLEPETAPEDRSSAVVPQNAESS